MLKNKNIFKLTFIFLLVISPWIVNTTSISSEIISLNRDSTTFYQKNSCDISLYDFLNNNVLRESFEFRFESYSDISCFGKIQYIEPTANNYVIFIGNHLLINLLVQSLIWLTLTSFISLNTSPIRSSFKSNIVITTLLFSLHFLSEENFYSQKNINYSNIFSFENYLLMSYVLSIFLITYFVGVICNIRTHRLILYFPFLFLVNGIFSNTNINFFIIVLVFYGIENLKKKNKLFKFNIIYLIFLVFWNFKKNLEFEFFDIDKLAGFSPTTNNNLSLNFWFLVIFLLINGLYYLIQESKINNLEPLLNNFLISGFLIVLFGIIASTNQVTNFLIYFTFGQSKFSRLGLESVAGNTWRGLAPSAEMIGEFFALVLLYLFLMLINKNLVFKNIYFLYLIFIIYGLFRSNNVASVISLIAVILFVLINKINSKFNILFYLIIIITGIVSLYFLTRQNTYSLMGQSVISEGYFLVSENIEDDYVKVRLIDLVQDSNFLEIENLLQPYNLISTSLTALTKNLTTSINLKFFPNLTSILGVFALMINRSEKLGIFFAKYDPSTIDFLFGYGPLNLVNYNFDNNIITNGLVLPHSSFFSYLVFVGILGLLLFLYVLAKILFNGFKKKNLFVYLIIFLIINYLKSDAILYFPSFLMFTTLLLLIHSTNYDVEK